MPEVIIPVTIGNNTTKNMRFWENSDGNISVVGGLSGRRLAEQLRNTAAVSNVLTFADEIDAIEIYHEAATWQTFIVNGLTLTVPAGGYRTLIGGTPAATVTIPASLACIVGRLE